MHDLTGAPGIAVFRKEKLADDGTVGFGMVTDDDAWFIRQILQPGKFRLRINSADNPDHKTKQNRPLLTSHFFTPFQQSIVRQKS